LGFKGEIKIDMDFPAGCGFGMSGASALASAFAINEALNLNRSFFELADLAHNAEVINRTGLGDVVTQSFGGVVVRKSASCPSKCVVDRFLWNIDLDILIMGELPTEQILSDFSLDKIAEIGRECLKEFLRKPTVETLFKQSKSFALKTGLMDVDSAIVDAVEAVESSGGLASMVMLGRAVFAMNGEVLREFDGIYLKIKIDHCGVRLLG
jgi:pantoate kinase